MKIQLSVVGRSGHPTNLRITADATATVGDVAAALASASPVKAAGAVDPATVPLRVLDPAGITAPITLTSHTPLDESGLRSGDLVNVSAVVSEHSPAQQVAIAQVVSGPDEGRSFPLPPGSP